ILGQSVLFGWFILTTSEKLRSSVLFVDSMEVTGAKAHSRYRVVSSVCISVEDLSLADRFSLIDESKDIVPAPTLPLRYQVLSLPFSTCPPDDPYTCPNDLTPTSRHFLLP
ncbi:Manganese peroxidase 1, partial [Dissostichus eleginoides]